MEENKTRKRSRGNGEGSIFFNNSKGLWVAELTIGFDENGKQKQKSFYGKLRKDVAKKLEEKQTELRNDKYIDKSVITLNQLMTDFADEQYNNNQIGDNTYKRKLDTIKIISKSTIVNKPIQKISTNEINAFLTKNIDYSNSVISKIYQMLETAYNRAILHGIISSSPFYTKVLIIKPISNKETKDIDALTVDEQKTLIQALKEDTSKCNKNVIYIEMFLGLRIGEILALKKSDIKDERVIQVSRALTVDKNDKVVVGKSTKIKAGKREVTIMDVALPFIKNALDEYVNNENELLFTNSKGLICRPSEYNAFFKEICKNAGIRTVIKIIERKNKNGEIKKINHATSNVNQHMLRHTFATRAIESGIDPIILQHSLGHNKIDVTLNTYTTIFEKHKKKKLEPVSNYFQTLLDN